MANLLETVVTESDLTVDREAGVIRGVKILGRASANGRTYSDRALNDAVRLYEGVKVNLDHPPRDAVDKERTVIEGFGELRATRLQGDGVFGDLHYLKSHPYAEPILETAERFPKKLGLSHNASGETSGPLGSEVVESLTLVRSVDMVGKPATNKGLFESEDPMPKKTLKSILEAAPESENRKRLKALLEMPEAPAMGVEPTAEVEAAPESDPNEDVKAALAKAAQGIVKKMIDGELDKAEGFKKLKELLGMAEKATGDSGTPAPAAGGDAAMESVKEAIAELKQAQAESDARSLLESKNIEATEKRVKALIASDADMRAELLELWPKKGKPAYSPGILESEDADELPFWMQSNTQAGA